MIAQAPRELRVSHAAYARASRIDCRQRRCGASHRAGVDVFSAKPDCGRPTVSRQPLTAVSLAVIATGGRPVLPVPGLETIPF
jgi:hypothetical protein